MPELSILKILNLDPGQGIRAEGIIPEKSEFFQDHFPDFPVLPGVLALEMLKQTAEHYLRHAEHGEGKKYYLKQIRSTKFHTYLKPGDPWESQLRLVASKEDVTEWEGKLISRGRVAVSARLFLAPSHQSSVQLAS
ncbi:MAG: 3-hydroxyacyl-ACP dehydratase FabZ family protein [Candidatus Omnitrophota bacterium]